MAAAKQKLAAGRETCLLFDTPKLTRRLEDLFRQMWKEFEAGSLPVPDLTNLDVYFDLGKDQNLGNVGTLTDEAYGRRYEEKLYGWHQTYEGRHAPLEARGLIHQTGHDGARHHEARSAGHHMCSAMI